MASKEGRAGQGREREKVKVSDRAGIWSPLCIIYRENVAVWASISVPAWSVLHG